MRVNCDLKQILSSSILPTHMCTHGLLSTQRKEDPLQGRGIPETGISAPAKTRMLLKMIREVVIRGHPHITVKS